MLGFLEGADLIIVLVLVVLVFGGSKLPQLARSLGEAQREFKKASPTANLVVNALEMAIENRQAEGVVVHSRGRSG
jgi:TatA/E family protein of Tat protein translocase